MISNKDIGKKYNYLTVLDVKKEKNKKYWLCKCSLCGTEKWIRSDSVISGKQKSCGCLKAWNFNDLSNKRFGKLTAIDVTYKQNGAYYWNCICDCGNKVVIRGTHLSAGDIISCGCYREERGSILSEVGRKAHIKKNIINDTNISIINRITPNSSNTSGVTGVIWDKSRNKWRASINFQNKNIFLGYFDEKEKAINARKIAEEKYFLPVIIQNNKRKLKEESTNKSRIDRSVIGQKFNKLTILDVKSELKITTSKSKRITYYFCECDCGNKKWIVADKVKSGRIKSCGCGEGGLVDLTGKKFGKLTVIKRDLTKKNHHVYWICKCECGGERSVRAEYLRNGTTLDCGCSVTKKLEGEKFNRLTVIDLAYKKGRTYYWNCICDCGNKTVVSSNALISGTTKSCGCLRIDNANQILKNAKKEFIVENTNLKLISRKTPSKANTSGYTGVLLVDDKWRAEISFKNKTYILGLFDEKEDAIKARQNAEEKFFNPILKKYGYLDLDE